MEDVSAKLFTAFNDVTYHDEPHKYYVDGKQLISVTTLLGKYEIPFNEEYWSGVKSKEYDIPKSEILHLWKYINKIGTERGSIIHDYAENLFLNKVFPYPKQRIVNMFGNDPIWDSYLKSKKHVDKFYRISQGKLIPVKTELVVFDREYGIGGMVDLLFWNVKDQEFQIWDWKTNKEFTGWHPKGYVDKETGDVYKEHTYTHKTEGKENYTGVLGFLKKNDMNHYSLQLGTYKHIIEKNTGIKLGQSHLVWVSHTQKDFYAIKTLDHSMYVEKMINDYINNNN
jgi:hypothetical protein